MQRKQSCVLVLVVVQPTALVTDAVEVDVCVPVVVVPDELVDPIVVVATELSNVTISVLLDEFRIGVRNKIESSGSMESSSELMSTDVNFFALNSGS